MKPWQWRWVYGPDLWPELAELAYVDLLRENRKNGLFQNVTGSVTETFK